MFCFCNNLIVCYWPVHSAGTDSEADIDRAASIAADLIQRFNFVSLSNFPQDYDNKTEGWGG